jgi:hypothetical protein
MKNGVLTRRRLESRWTLDIYRMTSLSGEVSCSAATARRQRPSSSNDANGDDDDLRSLKLRSIMTAYHRRSRPGLPYFICILYVEGPACHGDKNDFTNDIEAGSNSSINVDDFMERILCQQGLPIRGLSIWSPALCQAINCAYPASRYEGTKWTAEEPRQSSSNHQTSTSWPSLVVHRWLFTCVSGIISA